MINDSKGKCCICEINQVQHFVHGSVSEIYFFLFGAHNARGKKVCSNRFSVSYVLAGWRIKLGVESCSTSQPPKLELYIVASD